MAGPVDRKVSVGAVDGFGLRRLIDGQAVAGLPINGDARLSIGTSAFLCGLTRQATDVAVAFQTATAFSVARAVGVATAVDTGLKVRAFDIALAGWNFDTVRYARALDAGRLANTPRHESIDLALGVGTIGHGKAA